MERTPLPRGLVQLYHVEIHNRYSADPRNPPHPELESVWATVTPKTVRVPQYSTRYIVYNPPETVEHHYGRTPAAAWDLFLRQQRERRDELQTALADTERFIEIGQRIYQQCVTREEEQA